ncbi:hypothetical protein JX265_006871 [Neoarthrinium moseri]|uniref:Cupin type-1 domain-containing protein n=1 Tax=Neoarthrinium moseri TaxID=1658444 RepID=A0A9P9WL26_9PEZI|nr:hypothetical protein JX265_006871 [Neoarthrinium moseri]
MAAPHRRDNSSTQGLSLTAQLQLADTAIQRYSLLADDKDFVYSFGDDKARLADRQTFPPLVGTGGAMAVGDLPACSMTFVHLHPRSAELFTVISGRILTEMVPETGVLDASGKQRVIRTELGPKQMTVFPMGSFHTQLNPDCEPASAVAAFTSEDMGASAIASQLFSLSDSVVENTFGQSIAGEDIDKVRNAIPKTVAFKVEECLAKCGLQKRAV